METDEQLDVLKAELRHRHLQTIKRTSEKAKHRVHESRAAQARKGGKDFKVQKKGGDESEEELEGLQRSKKPLKFHRMQEQKDEQKEKDLTLKGTRHDKEGPQIHNSEKQLLLKKRPVVPWRKKRALEEDKTSSEDSNPVTKKQKVVRGGEEIEAKPGFVVCICGTLSFI